MRLCVCVLTVCLAGFTQPAAADPIDDYVRSQLKARHLPGVSPAVVKDGRLVKAAGYGLASLELNASTEWTSLGEERLTDQYFNLDPALARLCGYRVAGSSRRQYLTVRLNVEGQVLGVLTEDQ